jgi:hypothetical protein
MVLAPVRPAQPGAEEAVRFQPLRLESEAAEQVQPLHLEVAAVPVQPRLSFAVAPQADWWGRRAAVEPEALPDELIVEDPKPGSSPKPACRTFCRIALAGAVACRIFCRTFPFNLPNVLNL